MLGFALRSLFAVLTACSLLFSVGISSSSAYTSTALTSDTDTQEDGTVTVRILQSVPGISHALQNAAAQYVEETGAEAVFQIQTVSGRNDYRAALRSKVLSGETVDLFHLLDFSDAVRLRDMLADVSSLAWAECANTDGLQIPGNEGFLCGIPYSLEGIGFLVNRDMFSAAGISVFDIDSYTDLQTAIVQLQTAIDTGNIASSYPNLVAVTDLAAQDTDYLSTRAAEILLSDAFVSPQIANSAVSLSIPHEKGTESLFKLMASASPQRGNWSTFAQGSEQKTWQEFAGGEIAMLLENTTAASSILAINPELENSIALLPVYLEDSEDEDPGKVFIGTSAWWGINAASAESVQQQAAAFLEWLYTSESGTALFAESFCTLSPYAENAALPVDAQLQSIAETATAVPWLTAAAPVGWGEDTAAAQIAEYFTQSEKTWEAVVSACKEGWAQKRED